MLSGARRSSEGRDCFFRVISNSQPFGRVATQALLPGNCGWGWTGSGQRRWIKAIWLHWMTSSCFLCLCSSKSRLLLHHISISTFCFSFCSLIFLTTEFDTKAAGPEGFISGTQCSARSHLPSQIRETGNCLETKTNKQNDGWSSDLDRFPHQLSFPCLLQLSASHPIQKIHNCRLLWAH